MKSNILKQAGIINSALTIMLSMGVAATPSAAAANQLKPRTTVSKRVRPVTPGRPGASGFRVLSQQSRPRYQARIAASHYSQREMSTVFEIGGPDKAEAASEFVKMLASPGFDTPQVTKLENGRLQVIVPGYVDSKVYVAFVQLIQPRLEEDSLREIGAHSPFYTSASPGQAAALTKPIAAARRQLKSFVDRLFGAKPSLLPPGYTEADFVPSKRD